VSKLLQSGFNVLTQVQIMNLSSEWFFLDWELRKKMNSLLHKTTLKMTVMYVRGQSYDHNFFLKNPHGTTSRGWLVGKHSLLSVFFFFNFIVKSVLCLNENKKHQRKIYMSGTIINMVSNTHICPSFLNSALQL
jgi:hypothetical protein